MTRTWPIADAPDSQQRKEIADALAEGAVLLLPTDTIYGLHALAHDAGAVDRIAALKGREETKPFIVLAASIDQLQSLGILLDREMLDALATIWPAPLTAILPLREAIAASRGAPSLAVRIPALDWLRQLIARTGPLVSTSANRSGEPPITQPAFLSPDLHAQLDGIVDAGPQNGEPSTIVDLTADEPRLVRAGEESFTQKVWKSLRKTL